VASIQHGWCSGGLLGCILAVVRFRDRIEAGQALGARLRDHFAAEDAAAQGATSAGSPGGGRRVVVLGLPRGGVVVAHEVAATLGTALDVIGVRKLGAPQQPELAVGAIGEGGVEIVDQQLVDAIGLSAEAVAAIAAREREVLERRAARYRAGRAPVAIEGRTPVVVDDGIATGATMQAALSVVRAKGAARIIAAVPVAPPSAADELSGFADDVVALLQPSPFVAVGAWYRDFSAVSDDDVVRLLAASTA
jgi:predicted phosphoribosyltransferase